MPANLDFRGSIYNPQKRKGGVTRLRTTGIPLFSLNEELLQQFSRRGTHFQRRSCMNFKTEIFTNLWKGRSLTMRGNKLFYEVTDRILCI